MPLKAVDFGGDPFLGVFTHATEEHLFVPPASPPAAVEAIEKALGVSATPLSIGGTRVVGTLLAANTNGIIVGDIATADEVKLIKKTGLNVQLLKGRHNAAGNLVLANDRAALVHPRLTQAQVQSVADTLGVEVEKGTVAGLYTVGSAAVVTGRGLLAHPKVDDDEIEQLQDLFKVEVGIGTVNYGSPMIGSGVVANSKGACFGTPSTGVEKGRVAEALGLI